MIMTRSPKQPKPHQITAHVRDLKDAQLAQLVADLLVATKVGQSTLATAFYEQKRRRKQKPEATTA